LNVFIAFQIFALETLPLFSGHPVFQCCLPGNNGRYLLPPTELRLIPGRLQRISKWHSNKHPVTLLHYDSRKTAIRSYELQNL